MWRCNFGNWKNMPILPILCIDKNISFIISSVYILNQLMSQYTICSLKSWNTMRPSSKHDQPMRSLATLSELLFLEEVLRTSHPASSGASTRAMQTSQRTNIHPKKKIITKITDATINTYSVPRESVTEVAAPSSHTTAQPQSGPPDSPSPAWAARSKDSPARTRALSSSRWPRMTSIRRDCTMVPQWDQSRTLIYKSGLT